MSRAQRLSAVKWWATQAYLMEGADVFPDWDWAWIATQRAPLGLS